MTKREIMRFAVVCCLFGCGGVSAAELPSGGLPVFPPLETDEISLRWLNGAPILNAFRPEDKALAKYRPEHSALVIRGAHFGMVIDRSQPTLITRLTANPPAPSDGKLDSAQPVDKNWSPSALQLSATWQGRKFFAAPKPVILKGADWARIPVRIIETGSWYQHVQLTDIALVAEDGESLAADSTLDIRAWGDRALIEWTITPESPLTGAQASLELESEVVSAKDAQSLLESGAPVHLRIAFHQTERGLVAGLPVEGKISIMATAKGKQQPQVAFSELSGGWEITLPGLGWPNPDKTDYPEALLDRISEYGLTVENSGSEPILVPLRMMHPRHPMTGLVPMLVDAEGRQTGLPVQVSKNWHISASRDLPYEGVWAHGSAVFRVPPHSTVQLGYNIVHAQWQGVPSASLAQLCLVGWGGNGYWYEFALGSWGESFCVQPERMLRRSLITDVRPILVLGSNGKKWTWPTNVGGGDVMKVIGADGQYLPWRTLLAESRMIGPNLAQLGIEDLSRDGRLAVKTNFFLPRSDDLLRSYVRVRLDVLEDVAIKSVSFFQLGSDYYNQNKSDTLAFGDGEKLLSEHQPDFEPWKVVVPPVAMEGSQPWMTLYGALPAPGAKSGYATRGLILRDYQARLGGEAANTPYFAGISSFVHKEAALGAEIVPPPGLKTLRKGDWVEFTVEFVVFPAAKAAFFGSDAALTAALDKGADTWKMTAWEAAGNQPVLELADGSKSSRLPLVAAWENLQKGPFQLKGGNGFVPLRITGLANSSGWEIEEELAGEWQRLGQQFPEEANPQITYRPATSDWELILSLRTRDQLGKAIPRKLRFVTTPKRSDLD